MKNRWKNTAFFAQVMVLCLCLAADSGKAE